MTSLENMISTICGYTNLKIGNDRHIEWSTEGLLTQTSFPRNVELVANVEQNSCY